MSHYQVTAFLDEATSVQEVSKVFEGLHRLERRDEIDLRIRSGSAGRLWPRVVLLAAQAQERVREIAIDLSDQRDLFDNCALDRADVYFKRSFSAQAVAGLPARLRAKIKPFGLNNPAIGLRAALGLMRARLRTGRSIAKLAADARQLLALPSPKSFECAPDQEAKALVLFQTRLWPSDDAAVIALNEQRAALVRRLRRTLGERFIGGVVPSAFASRHYQDIVTQSPSSMRDYPKLVKRALIGIYTRGLHDSVAFKMSEYLAASRCIVADGLDSTLPKPLTEGCNYLTFSDAEQCIAQCEALLSDRSRAREMRRYNWDYYNSQVEPGAHLLTILERAFARERT